MGAWGLGLFQSDHDLDIVAELDLEAGVVEADVPSRYIQNMNDHDITTYNISKTKLSLYAKECMFPKWMYTRMEDGTHGPCIRNRLIEVYTTKTKAQGEDLCNPYGAAYKTVILGAYLMTLGCNLSNIFKALLLKLYSQVGLLRDGVQQMKKALAADGFKNGRPYDFGSVPQEELDATNTEPADWLYPKSCLLNTASPHDSATQAQIAAAGLTEQRIADLEGERRMIWALGHVLENLCAVCGSVGTVRCGGFKS